MGSSESPEEWHAVLGVSRNATLDEAQAAFRELIRQYHPDKVATLGPELRSLAERKTKALNIAYSRALEVIKGRR